MARFYFNLHECGVVTDDAEGREFDDLDQARRAAIIDARALMCEEIGNGRLCMSCAIEIANAQGEPVLRVPFKDAVVLTGI